MDEVVCSPEPGLTGAAPVLAPRSWAGSARPHCLPGPGARIQGERSLDSFCPTWLGRQKPGSPFSLPSFLPFPGSGSGPWARHRRPGTIRLNGGEPPRNTALSGGPGLGDNRRASIGAFFFEKHGDMRQLSDKQHLTPGEGNLEVQSPSGTIRLEGPFLPTAIFIYYCTDSRGYVAYIF